MIAHGICTYYGKDVMQKNKIEILGKINNKVTKFLLDTGASITVVDRRAIKFEKLEHENNFYLETANNSELKMLGTTIVQIEIGKILINHKVIIVDNLCNPVLIGLDIMKKINTIVDLKNNVILFTYNGN
jgi:predicted aspartyl protease